jgi:formiminotetrahydrofolate cyclodeaminase
VLTGLSLPAFLEELAAPREAPGSGSALAVALAMAAAVAQMATRLSGDGWPEAAGVAAQAESLRDRAIHLADEDAEVYRRALEARADRVEDTQERRDWALGRATAAAADPPLALVRLAADLAELCQAAAARVAPHVVAAAALAAGVARGARELVAVNLTALPDDPRVVEAGRLCAEAEAAARALS